MRAGTRASRLSGFVPSIEATSIRGSARVHPLPEPAHRATRARVASPCLISSLSIFLCCACASPEFSAPADADAHADADASVDQGTFDGPLVIYLDAGCPSGTIQCQASCVDPSQPANCGTCANVCDASAPLCSAGSCVQSCPVRTSSCGGACVDTTSNPLHCGSCSKACPSPEAGVGSATCTAGACGFACLADAGTPLLCPGGQCVNPQTDPHNCGGCGQTCSAVTGGTAACVAGADGGPTCGASCAAGFHGVGAGCDTTCSANAVDPSTDPCVVADGTGTFVSPTGTDDASCGTKESPCATIGGAMTVAAGGNKRVYACGTFTTQVQVNASQDGVTVYGGLECESWTYSASTPTTVAPTGLAMTGTGSALVVQGTTTGVTFEDFAFISPMASAVASATPESSVAVFASGSVLTLTRVAVMAGSGQPGSKGTTGSNYGAPSPPALGTTMGVAAGGAVVCEDGMTSQGGTGGPFVGDKPDGAKREIDGIPDLNGTGFGGTGSPMACAAGATGSTGAASNGDAMSASSSGSVDATGWTVGGSGGKGYSGLPGQGGGEVARTRAATVAAAAAPVVARALAAMEALQVARASASSPTNPRW